ncbi:MAG: arginine deiminase-related protein [Thermomicrobiales bacterium]
MANQGWGGHSMVWPLERVLVYPPVPPAEEASWEAFGYLRPMRHTQALEEHEAFRQILRDAGVEVLTGEIDNPMLQDAIFPFDPVFTTNAGAVLCRMGKPLRDAEVDLAEQTMAELNIPVAGRIEPPECSKAATASGSMTRHWRSAAATGRTIPASTR